jgi:hypothetical protein
MFDDEKVGNVEFEWPSDTVFIQYNDTFALHQIVEVLAAMGFTFVVSPKINRVAMSRQASEFLLTVEAFTVSF